MLIGTISTTLGMAIKCLINDSFWICAAGQVVCAVGQPFLCNSPAKLANTWFAPNERVIALTVVIAG